jgi:DNA (cytosine-5)-methyltransferase 1
MVEINRAKPELGVVSLFSGGGGLDLGLEAVGFSTLFATDIDAYSCTTLRWGKEAARQRGSPFLQHTSIHQADINDLTSDFILETIKCGPGEIALLAGGPPCQAFSVFGKRQGRNDPRGRLVFEYLKILAGLRPQAFVFENVYGLLTIESGRVLEDMLEALSNPAPGLHYEISVHRVNAVDYGVPQFRDRVFIIGSIGKARVSKLAPAFARQEPTLFLPRWRIVREAFQGLPELGLLPNHTGRVHSDRIIERYASLPPGARDPFTRINKLNLNQPSFTIVVGSDKGGGKGHIHPTESREVTPRESARIQTFPDWWAFSGTSRHPIRQIGNAVPPLLGAAIGNEIRAQLFGLEKVEFEDVLRALSQEHLFRIDKTDVEIQRSMDQVGSR